MADNIQVINAANATVWLRAIDQGNGTLIMASVPMLPNGTAMLGVQSIASSIPVNPASGAIFPVSGTVSIAGSSGTTVVNLAYVGGTAISLGQAVAATSIPVVLPSNQVVSALITNASLTATINGTANINLVQVGGSAVTLGQKTAASSIPVTFASDNVFTATFSPVGSSFTTVISTAGAPAAIAVKATSGTLLGGFFYNNATTNLFVKIWNATAGGVTVGTNTTNLIATFGIPGGSYRDITMGNGIVLSTAICYAITGLVANTDTTSVAINDITGLIQYN